MDEKINQLIKEIRDLEESQDFIKHLNKIRDKKIELITLKRECIHDFYIVQDGFYYCDGEKEYYADIVCVKCGKSVKDCSDEEITDIKNHKNYINKDYQL